MGLIVQKFGGTSVADAEKIHRAARRAIRAGMDGKQVVMVVSAMGRTTDELLALAREVSANPPRRELDMLLTTGEQVSIALMAMAIDAAGHEAISLTAGQLGLVTDSAYTRARIQTIHKARLDRELAAGKVVIVAGFQGIDASGEITTLGRGASDTTAAALAAVLDAEICEIYTDVDGVYTADPRIVPAAGKIDKISYDEMLEMAGSGAGVMHSRAIEFAKKFNVPIHVRSALTDAPGTLIMAETEGMEEITVRGATLKEDLAGVVLTGVPNRAGIAAEIFTELAQRQVLIDDITQTIYEDGRIANIGFSTTTAYLREARAACERVRDKLGLGGVEIDEDVSKISVIGVGMRSHTGVAAKMFEALSEAGINIETISTSEIVISCIVRHQDGPRALQAVHSAFGLDQTSSSSLQA
ncbi:MAG TPA: aspartate kinase [Phycisphaerae bacterium]|nr:aspartate kinase [Phycisphaerae bacterium]